MVSWVMNHYQDSYEKWEINVAETDIVKIENVTNIQNALMKTN